MMPRHIEQIVDVSALVEAALDSGDKDKAIQVLLDALMINNQNVERCASKLNELVEMLNLQQQVLEAILGSEDAVKH